MNPQIVKQELTAFETQNTLTFIFGSLTLFVVQEQNAMARS